MNTQQIITNGLTDVVMTMISVLTAMVGYYLKQHFTGKQIATAAGIAEEAVRFVAQAANQLGLITDVSKYQNALSKAKELAGKAGINLTDSQWETLLESAYKKVKDELAQLVGNATPYTMDEIKTAIKTEVGKDAPAAADIASMVRMELSKYLVIPQDKPVEKDPIPEDAQTAQ